VRDLSTLAKLLAEEDIHVVHKKQSTAAFDVKNRELSLPIWKEMSKDVQELMTCHEVGHALWTPIEMLEKAQKENIEFSFVNVLEDVRIEKKVQNKYLGSVRVFNRGYQELIGNNFFGTKEQDVSLLNLIDRINLHYKHFSDVPFSDAEMVWVKKSNQTVTPDDVLQLAKDLYDYIQDNPESQSQDTSENDLDDHMDAIMGQPDPSGQEENSDQSEEDIDGSGGSDDKSEESSEEDSSGNSGKSSDEKGSEETKTNNTGSEKSDDTSGEKSETKNTVAESQSRGGKGSQGPITAVTDSTSKESASDMLDNLAKDRNYAFVPKINLKEVIIDYKQIMNMYNNFYTKSILECNSVYSDNVLSELDKFTKDNKKTVSYMVKEFEMKIAADQYSRASTSKTGSLDMGRLHTYKYNDDLFKKVTTLPGATNHGLVLFLDWSGSMSQNLQGTLNQLYNLVWFCKRAQIPFEVFAFTDQYGIPKEGCYHRTENKKMTNFKSGDLIIEDCHLLQFFSSKMNSKDLYKMMHNLNMYASNWTRNLSGQRYGTPRALELGGTPLGQAAACALEFVPMFKKKTGVQKINTVFLTDGHGDHMTKICHVLGNDRGDETNSYKNFSWSNDLIMTDSVTNTSVSKMDHNGDTTQMLLELLRKRVPEMNIVNFFVAGSGRSGKVCKHTVRHLMKNKDEYWYETNEKVQEMIKKINKENVGIFVNKNGFDQVYVLPGLNRSSGDEGLNVAVGASKAQLKKAFGKMATGKLNNRPLLNNFVKMIA